MGNEDLKKLQDTELGILKAVADLCEKYEIRYYLDSGTLIGAIRHDGFIPWDDDIDIAMPYSDYCKFLSIAQEELGDGYFIQNFSTEDNYLRSYSKVRLKGTLVRPVEWRYWNICHAAWIDIFPMFYSDSNFDVRWKTLIYKLSTRLQSKDFYRNFLLVNGKTVKNYLKYLYASAIGILPIKLRKRIHKSMLDYVFSKKSGRYLCRCDYLVFRFDSEWFVKDIRYHQFEGHSFRIPYDYDKVLRYEYGDYMQIPPEDKRGNHGEIEISL